MILLYNRRKIVVFTPVGYRYSSLKVGTDYETYSTAQPDTAAKNMMFASVDSQRTCCEYVRRQSCIAAERTKNCRVP